ncbi:DUF7344 domain-containing protein [Halobellus rufus]|uniref:DUF7344 domain-containing protein n=1 Tax=Halobellus rufus TaxID=1448860 RepID=UPI0012DFF01B|nr:hypothetical protein [Halobellus rufus]
MATGELRRPSRDSEERGAMADIVFDALSNRRRRLVVRELRKASRPLDIGTLSTRIAAHENGIDSKSVTHGQRKSVYTSLHQNHLPKLTDAGFVAADRKWVGLRLTERAAVLESHLDDDALRMEDTREIDGLTHRTHVWSTALAVGFSTTGAIALYPGSNPSSVLLATVVALCATFACYWFVTDLVT